MKAKPKSDRSFVPAMRDTLVRRLSVGRRPVTVSTDVFPRVIMSSLQDGVSNATTALTQTGIR